KTQHTNLSLHDALPISANELRIPTGVRVELALNSADVLHSFWVPAYAGKVDMVPGRTNHLQIIATEPGIVRGQCAEYCGGAHARSEEHTSELQSRENLV